MPGLEYAGVDAAAHMFDEGAEQAPVDVGEREGGVDDETGGDHGGS